MRNFCDWCKHSPSFACSSEKVAEEFQRAEWGAEAAKMAKAVKS
jgi:hypothetical protein